MSRRRASFQPYEPLDDTVVYLTHYGQRRRVERAHPLTVDRRRREQEAYDRMCLRVRWFCLGVVASWLMLAGVTLAHCASSGSC